MELNEKKTSILIVEDDKLIFKSLKRSLENLNYTVFQQVKTGEETLSLIEKFLPNLILMDINLAGKIDGIETAKFIKNKIDVPIIYLTGDSDEGTLVRAKSTGPFGYILKPYDIGDIRASIEIALYKHKIDKKLIESERKYRLLFEKMDSGVGLFEIVKKDNSNQFEIKILEINNSMKKIFNVDKSIIGEKLSELVPNSIVNWLQNYQKINSEKNIKSLTTYSSTLEKWLEMTVYKTDLNQFSFIINDISQKIHSEESMRLKDSAIESSISAVVIAEMDGSITYVNRSFLDIWGYSQESEVVGENISYFWDFSLEFAEKGDSFASAHLNGDFLAVKKNGDKFSTKVLASLIPDNDGNPRYITLSSVDITETILMENEIMKISEQERQFIGQDLHDGLGQKLTGISFLTEALTQSMLVKNYPEVSDLQEIKKFVDESIEHTRKISKGLCPVNLENYGVITALEELIYETSKVYGIKITFEKKGNFEMENIVVATNLYYIVREAINNSIKHGKASLISIKIVSNYLGIKLSVSDNGVGIDIEKKSNNIGIGIRNMNHRTNLIGGELNIYGKRNGFVVKLFIEKKKLIVNPLLTRIDL